MEHRTTPGILIFDQCGQLLFANHEAQEMQASLCKVLGTVGSLPEAICMLCRKQRQKIGKSDDEELIRPEYLVFSVSPGVSYSLRRFLINEHEGEKPDSHILVLIEKIVEKHQVDFEQVRKEFLLTKCETEVVRLISEGLTNREIGLKKFISENTVKTHIKNIMKKMNVSSRSEICSLLQ